MKRRFFVLGLSGLYLITTLIKLALFIPDIVFDTAIEGLNFLDDWIEDNLKA